MDIPIRRNQMTADEMLDTVAGVDPHAYGRFAALYKAEQERLWNENPNQDPVEYGTKCQAARTRIARNLFMLTFA